MLRGRDEVHVRIADKGIGIEEQSMASIVELLLTTKKDRTAAGLALAITKRILTDHKAEISASSSEGHGTLIRLSFRHPVTFPPLKQDYDKKRQLHPCC